MGTGMEVESSEKAVVGLVFREEEENLGLPGRGEEELVEWAADLASNLMD